MDKVEKWLVKYKDKLAHRYPTQLKALEMFEKLSGKNMVETGTVRFSEDWGAGMSTFIYGEFATLFDKHLYTVDISDENISLSKQVTQQFSEKITYEVRDSISYLTTFKDKINFLYLDSMDCPETASSDFPLLIQSQKHQKEEYISAENKLSDDAIILLDDCRFENGGKCGMLKPYLIERGWRLVLDEYQSLFTRI